MLILCSVNYYLSVDTAYQFVFKVGCAMETAKENSNHSPFNFVRCEQLPDLKLIFKPIYHRSQLRIINNISYNF